MSNVISFRKSDYTVTTALIWVRETMQQQDAAGASNIEHIAAYVEVAKLAMEAVEHCGYGLEEERAELMAMHAAAMQRIDYHFGRLQAYLNPHRAIN